LIESVKPMQKMVVVQFEQLQKRFPSGNRTFWGFIRVEFNNSIRTENAQKYSIPSIAAAMIPTI